MTLLARIANRTAADQSFLVGLLAAFALLCYGIWLVIRWFHKGPPVPEPWDDQIAAEVAKDETPALCHRCLTPHDPLANFCPDCGAPVGTYTNWLPYPYLFSIGDMLRTGTTGAFKRSPLTIIGFFLFSLAEYALFAPIYWFMFLGNLSRQQRPEHSPDPTSPASEAGDAANNS